MFSRGSVGSLLDDQREPWGAPKKLLLKNMILFRKAEIIYTTEYPKLYVDPSKQGAFKPILCHL